MARFWITVAFVLVASLALAADQSPSEKVIAEAIAGMEAKRDRIADPLEQARIDKAIRELEALIGDGHEKPLDGVTVDLNVLRKKFAGKPIYDPKSGELTLKYDFPGRPQLADFDVGDKRVLVAKKMLGMEAGDELKHVAKFKTFTVSVVMTFKSMNGAGFGSSNGSGMSTGGANFDTIYLGSPGTSVGKIVPENVRRGSIPVMFNVASQKVSLRYAREVLTVPSNRPDDVHQLVLRGGNEGCGFSNLEIVGIPDPAWFTEFLKGE